ncbi:cytidine deaminase [Phenylobacterium immobile]|uniref:cytidine deaminase n=1 Tax=Phenylobacterium immobile TaxID=21 RepID=UPI000B1C45CF|nr:cytidine deaminase [Phenylobacterium immobile]
MTDKPALWTLLEGLLPRSHSPYSGVRVAAAVEDETGALHFGVNVENASYPEGVCAEGGAISALVAAGGRSIRRVYVASSLNEAIWPCGGCRQKILEFAAPGCEIISLTADGAQTHTIEELAPLGFRLARP